MVALTELTLKLDAVSLASMAAFVTLDPGKLSDALLSRLRLPSLVSFAVSCGCRMLPILKEEVHTIVDGHRLRSAPLASTGLLGWRAVERVATILVVSFHPMTLNTAKAPVPPSRRWKSRASPSPASTRTVAASARLICA